MCCCQFHSHLYACVRAYVAAPSQRTNGWMGVRMVWVEHHHTSQPLHPRQLHLRGCCLIINTSLSFISVSALFCAVVRYVDTNASQKSSTENIVFASARTCAHEATPVRMNTRKDSANSNQNQFLIEARKQIEALGNRFHPPT